MKVLAVIGVIVLVSGLLVYLNKESRARLTGNAGNVTVQIAGDVHFEGSIGAGGSQRSVSGTAPASFLLDGAGSRGVFVAAVSKVDQGGELTVTLEGCPNGRRPTQTTSAPFGVVSVTC